MTAKVPKIQVYNTTAPMTSRPGMAGKIAVVGAFNTEETDPILCSSLSEAHTQLGTDSTFNGCAVIDDLFVGASSLLAVNITTWSGTTPTKTMTTTNLTNALAKIKGEDFDILFIAETLTDSFLPIITAFLDECFQIKYPAGFTGCLAGGTTSANVTSAGLCGQHCYGVITQSLTVGGTSKSLLKSIAYYTGIIAGMNVGNTMTMKTVPNVTGVSPELSFETGSDGKTLLEAGITTFKCVNRTGGDFVVMNSEQPNGYDLYINRVRDYVVKEMALHQFLGERNRSITWGHIEQELARVKEKCVNTLDLLEDINYKVVKKNSQCVDIYIESLLFAGVITEIDVYVQIEVE